MQSDGNENEPAVKAATEARLIDPTMLTVELAGNDDDLHFPLYGDDSDRVSRFITSTKTPASVAELREIEITADGDDPTVTLIAPSGELTISIADDALEHHSSFFEQAVGQAL